MVLAFCMHITRCTLIKFLHKPNINEAKVLLISSTNKPTWISDVIIYLLLGDFLEDNVKACNLKCR